MVKITCFHSPSYYSEASNLWCLTLEWHDGINPHFHTTYDAHEIARILSADSLDALRESTGQNIALIHVSEEQS